MFIFVNVLIINENSIILMTECGIYTCTNSNIIGNSTNFMAIIYCSYILLVSIIKLELPPLEHMTEPHNDIDIRVT